MLLYIDSRFRELRRALSSPLRGTWDWGPSHVTSASPVSLQQDESKPPTRPRPASPHLACCSQKGRFKRVANANESRSDIAPSILLLNVFNVNMLSEILQ